MEIVRLLVYSRPLNAGDSNANPLPIAGIYGRTPPVCPDDRLDIRPYHAGICVRNRCSIGKQVGGVALRERIPVCLQLQPLFLQLDPKVRSPRGRREPSRLSENFSGLFRVRLETAIPLQIYHNLAGYARNHDTRERLLKIDFLRRFNGLRKAS